MSQDIRDFVTPSCDLLGLGEPTHATPVFAEVRNELFPQLVERGFRSIALETDRVAALAANDFVQNGVGTLDLAMKEGFTHTFGGLDANRRLIAWMREYNENRPPAERLSFHGFDTQTENTSAPSPRPYLEYARDFLGLDVDIAGPAGDDERWGRTEAVLDAASSIGATADAYRLRAIAAKLLTVLRSRKPEPVTDAWSRAEIRLMAGIDMLRYHRQCAEPLEPQDRYTPLIAIRDAIMARNLLDIRAAEAGRGATLVFAHNLHLRRQAATMTVAGTETHWFPAGALVAPLLGDRYVFVATSLGRSEAIALQEPEADTYEGFLQKHVTTDWGLLPAAEIPTARVRTDPVPRQGYFPLDQGILDDAEAVLHIVA
ncbi:erythromycin esterase family protein [Amycolatopsis umgeniensis]|uniref:Erythromycin esterase-like protein n=1 Tax=Amycolatopsis umgeniensis TaxID=336628 RepID=A0A841AU22_9PSEU|nr:erythromycin esterase family protein [Amycolatopsis umgeniensis]MBB5850443.1 erythromycin esterase-like protein [Amycolatopsis umgeniensis]